MALGIENATEGYDSSNLGTLKEEIKTSCIEPAIAALETGLTDLNSAIDEIWVGVSANKFKEKMSDHVQSVQRQMKQKRDEVDAYLGNIVAQLQQVDENINI